MTDSFKLAPHEWATLRALLDDALDLPAAQREAWIDALDARHEPYKARLRSLLAHAADEHPSGPLNTLPKVETDQFAPRPGAGDRAPAVETVGPYRLLREIGSGGMASVWLAERDDMLQGRQVALKLPHGAWRGAGLAERLAREREILATLNHPNIARLYDAGVSADGQPYLALEYVEGERIDRWCARHELDVPQRLRLFLQVARAVAHAHANLVVHRDLKPSNILVTEAGEVRLLDFGIAKLLDQGVAEATELTHLGGRALTPEYAAPEQILGRPIGTAADVYALGVVLFELLCDVRPYTLARDSRGALEDAILNAEVPRPSIVAPATRRGRLKGDLDTIVGKALKKLPQERYATVDGLAEDIERHLAQRPVRAQPDSRWYRLDKFVRRNRLALGVATTVMVTVLGGAGLAIWQAGVARAEQRRADEVKSFIAAVFAQADPYEGGSSATRAVDLLKKAIPRIDRIDPARHETRIELLGTLGSSLLLLQETDEAEAAITRALEESRRHLTPDHPLAVSVRLLNAQVLRFRGRAAEMRAEIEALLPSLRSAGPSRDLATALQYLSHAALDEGKYAESEAAAAEGLAMARAALGDEDLATVQLAMMLAQTYQYGAPRPQQALAAAEHAMQLVLKVRKGEATHPMVTDMRHIYGRALNNAGQAQRAVQELERAAADASARVGPGGRKMAFILSNLARAQRRAGQLQAALDAHDRSHTIVQAQFKPESYTYGVGLIARGMTKVVARRAAQAQSDLQEAVERLTPLLGAEHQQVFIAGYQRALARAWAGEPAEAEVDLRQLMASYRPGAAFDLAQPMHALGIMQRLQGHAGQAVASQTDALARFGDGPEAALDRLHCQVEIGLAQLALGRAADAVATLRPTLAQFEALQSEVTPQRADAMLGLANALVASGDAAAARPLAEAADRFWQRFDPGSRWAAEAASQRTLARR